MKKILMILLLVFILLIESIDKIVVHGLVQSLRFIQ